MQAIIFSSILKNIGNLNYYTSQRIRREILSSPANNNYDKLNRKCNNFFFVTHEPTFTCGYERKIGSRCDGGKWICDPHRILKGGSCLVYLIGSV